MRASSAVALALYHRFQTTQATSARRLSVSQSCMTGSEACMARTQALLRALTLYVGAPTICSHRPAILETRGPRAR
jgi:hypothetical protein